MNAVIVSKGTVIATLNTDAPSGDILFSFRTVTDPVSQSEVLVNPQRGRITRSKKVLGSQEAKECQNIAICIDADLLRFRII